MVELALPDSNYYISRARAGVDPFVELAAQADRWEFATCGMVVLEVCRGRRDPGLLKRFQERFAIMLYVPAGNSVWERASQLAWSLDRQGIVLPAPDLLIAAWRAAGQGRGAHGRRAFPGNPRPARSHLDRVGRMRALGFRYCLAGAGAEAAGVAAPV